MCYRQGFTLLTAMLTSRFYMDIHRTFSVSFLPIPCGPLPEKPITFALFVADYRSSNQCPSRRGGLSAAACVRHSSRLIRGCSCGRAQQIVNKLGAHCVRRVSHQGTKGQGQKKMMKEYLCYSLEIEDHLYKITERNGFHRTVGQ